MKLTNKFMYLIMLALLMGGITTSPSLLTLFTCAIVWMSVTTVLSICFIVIFIEEKNRVALKQLSKSFDRQKLISHENDLQNLLLLGFISVAGLVWSENYYHIPLILFLVVTRWILLSSLQFIHNHYKEQE